MRIFKLLIGSIKLIVFFCVSCSSFASKIEKFQLESLYQRGNGNTFFIPVGEIGKKNFNEVNNIVIRGHVIPNEVLFTRTIGSKVYRSDMYDKNKGVQVELSMVNISNAMDNGYQRKLCSRTKEHDFVVLT